MSIQATGLTETELKIGNPLPRKENHLDGFVTPGSKYYSVSTNPEPAGPTLKLTGTTKVQFDISPQAINLGRSSIQYDILCPGEADKHMFFRTDHTASINQIELKTKAGRSISLLQDLDYWSTMSRLVTRQDDFLSRAKCDPDSPETIAAVRESGQFFAPMGKEGTLVEYLEMTTATLANASARTINGSFGATIPAVLAGTSMEFQNTVLPSQKFVRTVAENKALGVKVNFPLSDLPCSIFKMDKDVNFQEELVLHVTFNDYRSCGYATTGNPATAATAASGVALRPAEPIFSAVADFAAVGTLSNVQLNLATVRSAEEARVVDEMCREGFTVAVPSVHSIVRQNVAGVNNHAVRLNNSYGEKLKAAFTCVYASTESSNTKYMNNNDASLLYTDIQTSLAGHTLQSESLNVDDGTCYRYMRPLLKGSCVSGVTDHNQNGSALADNFSGFDQLHEMSENVTVSSGLRLDRQQDYNVKVTAVSASTQTRIFLVTEQHMSISAAGVRVGSLEEVAISRALDEAM